MNKKRIATVEGASKTLIFQNVLWVIILSAFLYPLPVALVRIALSSVNFATLSSSPVLLTRILLWIPAFLVMSIVFLSTTSISTKKLLRNQVVLTNNVPQIIKNFAIFLVLITSAIMGLIHYIFANNIHASYSVLGENAFTFMVTDISVVAVVVFGWCFIQNKALLKGSVQEWDNEEQVDTAELSQNLKTDISDISTEDVSLTLDRFDMDEVAYEQWAQYAGEDELFGDYRVISVMELSPTEDDASNMTFYRDRLTYLRKLFIRRFNKELPTIELNTSQNNHNTTKRKQILFSLYTFFIIIGVTIFAIFSLLSLSANNSYTTKDVYEVVTPQVEGFTLGEHDTGYEYENEQLGVKLIKKVDNYLKRTQYKIKTGGTLLTATYHNERIPRGILKEEYTFYDADAFEIVEISIIDGTRHYQIYFEGGYIGVFELTPAQETILSVLPVRTEIVKFD